MDDLLRQTTIKDIRKPSFGRCVCLIDLNLISLSLGFVFSNKLPVSLRVFLKFCLQQTLKALGERTQFECFPYQENEWGWNEEQTVCKVLLVPHKCSHKLIDQASSACPPTPFPRPTPFLHTYHILQFFLGESGRCTASPKEIIYKAPPTLTADYKNKSSWSFYSHKYLSMQTIDWGRFSDWNPTEP